MKKGHFKLAATFLFMSIFIMKMAISFAPAFWCLNNKAVKAVIMQLENETKSEKEDPEKDAFKEKKSFDENISHVVIAYITHIHEVTILHNRERSLYTEVYHPVIPTPPPNA
ncbi:hypothetical protein FPZ43_10435 [Mucilaginibacter pallidiroseus]|uniref:Uncharacterized protein n=1 Tax=Mucilaginibacter pallidiroseus TaxID=2599295 RepID=A0A563UDF4_9SPHI|nr:hypothetical protein [Mucilaginibacter pallidiroseus]TWR29364.1 hypothetical protein FPZ43_10435 [Mucilaginibacter pallidiroseus]